MLQSSTGLFLDRRCAFWHQIIGWKNTGVFPSPKHRACHLRVWIFFCNHRHTNMWWFSKKKSIQMCLWTHNPGSLGFNTGLVTDALKMGKSLPSLSDFLHLADVDSDTHHQIMFAKCLVGLAGRQHVIANCWITFFSVPKALLFSRNYFFFN